MKLKLTAKGVEKLSTTEVQEDFWDSFVPGLHLRVSGATGRKSWLVRYRANGAHRRVRLGHYAPESDPAAGTLSLADARDEARKYLSAASKGTDLREVEEQEREQHQGVPTFEEMADEVLKSLESRTRDATRQERARILRKELLPAWGSKPAAEITRRDVLTLIEAIRDRGAPVMANRVLALVKVLYSKALKRAFPTIEASPAQLLEPPAEEKGRDRYLTAKEVKAVWGATEPENPLTRGAVRLALLTGQRIGSVLAMRWDTIEENGAGALWTIPEEDFKGRRPHLVPLSAEAWAVLADLRPIADEGARHVFPSRAGAKVPHLTNFGKALTRIRKRSRVASWTIHDFRTTFRTHAVRAQEDGGLGIAPQAADAVLGHKEVTLGFEHYTGDKDRYMLHEKREALKAWGAFVLQAVEG